MKDVGFLATGGIFLCIGIVCMFWPEKIQSYALTHQGPEFVEKLNPFATWMRTRSYVATLRIVGAMSTGVALFILWIFTRQV